MEQGEQFGGGQLAGAPLLESWFGSEQLMHGGSGQHQGFHLGAGAQVLEGAVVQQADPANQCTGLEFFEGAGLAGGIGPGAQAAHAALQQDPDLLGVFARGKQGVAEGIAAGFDLGSQPGKPRGW